MLFIFIVKIKSNKPTKIYLDVTVSIRGLPVEREEELVPFSSDEGF